MKKVFLTLVLIALVLGIQEARGEDGLGVGIIIGEPTGLSVKKWFGETKAIDAAAAWSFSENQSFQFHTDYLVHSFFLTPQNYSQGGVPVYFGLGFRIKLRDENNDSGRNYEKNLIGVRIPFGISYLFADAPFDIFAEIVPVLDLMPDTHFDVNGAVGLRLYFR